MSLSPFTMRKSIRLPVLIKLVIFLVAILPDLGSSAWAAPLANSQVVTTNEDTPVTITLSGEGTGLSYHVVSAPEDGRLSGYSTATGQVNLKSLLFTPDPDKSGTLFLKFKAREGTVDSNIATVTININAVNDAPRFDLVNNALWFVVRPGESGVVKEVSIPAYDIEADSITNFQAGNLPSGATFDSDRGVIRWNLSYADKGREEPGISIGASDGTRIGTATVKLVVRESTTYFVEKGSSGPDTGTSWANAFEDFSQVPWTSIRPGDEIVVGGGPSGLLSDGSYRGISYGGIRALDSRGQSADPSGTPEFPILIRASREPGHDGKAFFSSIILRGNWWTIDGRKIPTPINTRVKDLKSVLNRSTLNFHVSNPQGISVIVGGHTGTKVFGVYVYDSGMGYLATHPGDSSLNGHGIWHNCTGTGRPVRESEIAYSSITGNKTDGINVLSWGRGLGGLKIHHVVEESNADDGIQFGPGGADVSYSRLRGRYQSSHFEGHPDVIQSSGPGVRVYNNLIISESNSALFFESRPSDSANYFVYGNEFVQDNHHSRWSNPAPSDPSSNYMVSIGTQWFSGDAFDGTWTNLVIMNNTFAKATDRPFTLSMNAKMNSLTLFQGYFLNNVIWDAGLARAKGKAAALSGCFGAGPTGIICNSSTYKVNYNVVGGWTDKYSYSSNLLAGPAFNTATGFVGNQSGAPSFLNPIISDRELQSLDLRLQPLDAIARNMGEAPQVYIPQSILDLMPDYDRDMDGNLRGAEGAWDVGAFEYGVGGYNISPRAPSSLKVSR